MSEWWTYRLTSFLLFSPRTYYRLIELYNESIWPAQLAGAACGLVLAVLLATRLREHDRLVAALLAGCWLWVGWAFQYQRYAQINWAASWFAAAFAVEALLLVALGIVARRVRLPAASQGDVRIAIVLVAIVAIGYPALAPLTGHAWTAGETFGMAPDPTAMATIAALALVRSRVRWLLLTVPVLWCVLSALTLWAMNARTAALVVVAGASIGLSPALRSLSAARRPERDGVAR